MQWNLSISSPCPGHTSINSLSARNQKKSKVKVTFIPARKPRLPVSPSFVALQFEALVVSLFDRGTEAEAVKDDKISFFFFLV